MGDEDVMVSKLYDVFWEERREKKERLSCEDGDRDEWCSHKPQNAWDLGFPRGPLLSLFINLEKKKENGKELFNFSFEKMNYFFFKIKTQGGEVEAVGSTEGYSPYSL